MIVEAEMILIKNARVMDPESGFDQVTDILLDGKRIRQIGKVDDVSGIEQVIDASGMIAAPGLIDVHVHFRDPGFTYKEDLQTGSAAAAAGGFTTVVCMANTKPVVDSVDIYKEIEDRCEQLPIKVWQAAAVSKEAVLKYGTLARMNPPLRTEEDRQRIIKGLQEGTIEIIATDHAPHSKEEKDKPLDQAPSGITGIETSLALGVTELVEKGYLSMMQLLEKMTINPAKLYNMEQGRLQEGKPADVVLFDPEEEWEVKEYKSKATNSPFTGWKLKGKVKYTICDGKIIEL